jgi:hypothetical protein
MMEALRAPVPRLRIFNGKCANRGPTWTPRMCDSEYRAAYNALEDEFTRAAIVSGAGPNGCQDRLS